MSKSKFSIQKDDNNQWFIVLSDDLPANTKQMLRQRANKLHIAYNSMTAASVRLIKIGPFELKRQAQTFIDAARRFHPGDACRPYDLAIHRVKSAKSASLNEPDKLATWLKYRATIVANKTARRKKAREAKEEQLTHS